MLLIYNDHETCVLKNGIPYKRNNSFYSDKPIQLPEAECYAAIHVSNDEFHSCKCQYSVPEFVSTGEVTKLKCRVGYYSIREKTFNERSIIIGNIAIESIVVFKNSKDNYNFITHARCWYYEDGETLVGREDRAWKEDTYVIPVETGYRIPDKLLSLINEKLELNLQYEAENDRYYYQKIYDEDRIAGLAMRRGGEISNFKFVVQVLKVVLLEYRGE